MKEDFVKIDLHIHTPASSDYQGKKNDDEYYSILRNAKSKQIKIIAITDHNTIAGYRELISLKARLTLEQQSLSTITDSQQVNNRLLDIRNELSLFEGILILPGVEFTARPGIHILLIFNTSVSPQSIEQFLADGGYDLDNLGKEDPSTLPSWDVVTLLDKAKAYDCIIIDAHTDSAKGIWDSLTGQTRIHCLRSQQLSGVCYKNEVQRDNINNILSSPQYKRTVPLAFLKSSDAHVSSDVAKTFTWAKLEDISFESLRKAFLNPLESFSTEEPSTTRILNKLTQLSNSFGIAKLESEDDARRFLQLACALSNSEGGYILLGVTENKNKIGMSLPAQKILGREISNIVEKAFSYLSKLEPYSSMDMPEVRPYILQSGRFILSLHFAKGTTLVNIEDDHSIYSVRGSHIISLSAVEAESLIRQNLLKDVEINIVSRLQAVENDCLQIRHVFISLPLMRKFEINSMKIMDNPVIAAPLALNPSQVKRLLNSPRHNGCVRGNVFYMDRIAYARLEYAYVRHSLPLWTVQHPVPKAPLKETLYLVPNGAIYYSKRDYPFYSDKYAPILKLHSDGLISTYGTRFAISFLKSSFYLWYLQNKHQTTNFTDYKIFSDLRLPIIKVKRPDSKKQMDLINDTFDDIIREEQRFLSELNKAYIRKEPPVQNDFIMAYNRRIADKFYDIDQSIYKLLDLSDKEIGVIENNLRFNKIYLPSNHDTSPLASE